MEIVTRPVLNKTRSPVKLIRIFRPCLYVTQLPGSIKTLNWMELNCEKLIEIFKGA